MDIVIPEITIYDKLYIKQEYITREELVNEFTYQIDDTYVSTLGETNDCYTLAVGCLPKLKYDKLIDKRISKKLEDPIIFTSTMHPAQQRTLDKFKNKEEIVSGILKAKCGWGKSFLGTGLICEVQEPTLILCHTKLLLDQWVSLIKDCTGYEPGIIGDGVYQLKEISVGLYISVNNRIGELHNKFTRIIVDEVHRCGADLFSTTLNSFGAKYKNGMSATPTRRDGKHILFPEYFSDLFVEAEEYRNLMKPFIEIKKVPFRFFVINPMKDWAKALTKTFGNEKYLSIIANDAKALISDGRTCALLCPRVAALEELQKLIPRSVLLTGITKNRDEILKKVGIDYDCILTTTLLDEAISCHILDTLILTEPVGKNFGKLEQRIGRIQREHPDKQPVLVRAYWLDSPILAGQQKIEYMWYGAQGYQTRFIN